MPVVTVLRPLPPTRTGRPGDGLRLLVLAQGAGSCAGIDLRSGALVRARWEPPWEPDLAAFHVASGVIANDDAPPDPACPEAVTLEGPPRLGRRLPRWRIERYLRPLLAPGGSALLGFTGPALPYWMVPGTHPSLTLVHPTRGPNLVLEAPGGPAPRTRPGGGRTDVGVWAWFEWDGVEHYYPLLDGRLAPAMATARRPRLAGQALAAALGGRPRHLVVALSPPREGHCYKTVVAILPRP